MTTPSGFELAEDDSEISECIETPRRLCAACKIDPLKNSDGTPRTWMLTIEEGWAVFTCPSQGCEGRGPLDCTDIPDDIVWAEHAPPVPVTVHVEMDCGGTFSLWHGVTRCDHGWTFQVTPAIDSNALASLDRLRRYVESVKEKHRKTYLTTSDEAWQRNPICDYCEYSWPCSTIIDLRKHLALES